MRKAVWLLSVLLSSALTYAQTGPTMLDLRTQVKNVNFSGASSTIPFQTGATLPATCSLAQIFYLSSAPAGQNLYGCTASNRWTLQAVSNSSLPAITGNSGKVLSTDGYNLYWTAAGGDVSGQIGYMTVTQIQGKPVAATAATAGQVLTWNGTAWAPAGVSGGSAGAVSSVFGRLGAITAQSGDYSFGQISGSVGLSQIGQSGASAGAILSTDGTNLLWSGLGGDLTGAPGTATVARIQGKPVAAIPPSAGQALIWNGSAWVPTTMSGGSGGAVSSVFGRLGAVTAQSGDYSFGQISGSIGLSQIGQSGASGGAILSTDGTNLLWSGLGGDLSGAPGSATVARIQGLAVAPIAPAQGQVLTWNAANSRWEPQNAPTSSTGPANGASMASQLGDFQATLANPTTLSVGSNCAFSTPCNVRFGAVTYSFTSGSTVSLGGGTGFAYIYISRSGQWTIGTDVLNLTCSGNCITQSGVSSFPTDSIPLFTWQASNGQWSALGLDQRAFLSSKDIQAGSGITTTDATGHTVVAADPSVVSLRVAVPAASNSACNAGVWAADTNYYYFCVSQNTWKRAALSSF